MLPRRNSTNITSNYVSQLPTTGPFGGRRPLNLVTNQQTFRASTFQTFETESPVSEISQQPIPPIPPRPTAFPHLPPGVSGFRRQSTFEHDASVPSQPFPQISEYPPIPTRHQQIAPGGGVGGFTSIPLPYHVSSPDSPHDNSSDYTYRFNTTPARLESSGPARYEPAGISEGAHAEVWPTYNKVSQEFDEKRLKQWNDDLDVLLIFAALFSAIVTTFLSRALDDLEPDYQKQSALILHQLLNGRDPSLANISDPTIPQIPTGSAIAVNCLWFASLATSLGASLFAIICKGWLTEYTSGANPVVGLLRACRRHIRFMAFQRLNVHTLVAFLPALLHSSVLLFIAGAVVYLWQMEETVAIVFAATGGIFGIVYLFLTVLPFITNFRHYSAFLFYRLSVAIGEVVVQIADIVIHLCYLVLRHVTRAILYPFVQTIFSRGALHRWYMRARTIFPGEYRHVRPGWVNTPRDPLDDIDTSQNIQEEAILWLSQVPLDPSESKALVSSLALISSSRPCSFQKPVIVLANLVLEASFRGEVEQEQTDAAINCVLVLGNIKFQSVVDRNSDCDHNVGGIPIPASVAWAAQQLTIDTFQAEPDTPHSKAIQAQLLTAAAWLSPVDGAGDVEWNGEKLKVQDRWEFVAGIKMMIERHVRNEKPLDNKVIITLIHGMHACIPRGDYGSPSSIVSFLPLLCDDYDSPWSEDEDVLRALITYALDLLLPPERRKPLVERKIRFDELASELIDALMANTSYIDVVAFAFWLASRFPYAFKSRKTMITDITYIWLLMDEATPENDHGRLNFLAVDMFVTIAQDHVTANRGLPRLTDYTALKLLSAALDYQESRLTGIYAMAMVLTLGSPAQVTTATSEIRVEPIIEMLFSIDTDSEEITTEESAIDIRIYSTLVLLKIQPTVELDVGKLKVLIVQMEKMVRDPFGGDSRIARRTEADINTDLDRVRWKATYLSALLFKFLPDGEREKHILELQARVRVLLESRGLSFAHDYESCLEPLVMDVSELGVLAAGQQGGVYTVYEAWIGGFPLTQLMGVVSKSPSGQEPGHPSFFNPRRWFG